jgi:hypothetical protein
MKEEPNPLSFCTTKDLFVELAKRSKVALLVAVPKVRHAGDTEEVAIVRTSGHGLAVMGLAVYAKEYLTRQLVWGDGDEEDDEDEDEDGV